MAVDSALKRAAVIGLVQPDSTIAQADRYTVVGVYGGLVAGGDVTAPADVTSLELSAGDEQITVRWTDPSNDDLDEIGVSWSPGGGSANVNPGDELYVITGLTNATLYTVTVVARDAVPNESSGAQDTATPAAPSTGSYSPRSPRKVQREPVGLIMGGE